MDVLVLRLLLDASFFMAIFNPLISGNHQKIDEWREEQALLKTKRRRPDLAEKYRKE